MQRLQPHNTMTLRDERYVLKRMREQQQRQVESEAAAAAAGVAPPSAYVEPANIADEQRRLGKYMSRVSPTERAAAAAAGDAAAQFAEAPAAVDNDEGRRCKLQMLHCAAAQGFAQAQTFLGTHFYNEGLIDGVEQQDFVEAAR